MSKYKKVDLSNARTIKVSQRATKVEITKSGRPCSPGESLSEFLATLPDYLKARDFLDIAASVAEARRERRAIVWMMGAHPIKVGLSPILIDLARRGFITHLAMNGAGAIHDLEMAFFGRTSEEVSDGLRDGSFGMVEETPRMLFESAALASKNELGLGEGIGKYIVDCSPKYEGDSILAACYQKDTPATVHMAIGTDTICQHPGFDGAVFGKLSHDDFLIFAESLSGLNGGVVLNVGSAVVLPEVFLKALTVARNIHGEVGDFTAVNFDMIQHYRPNTNVVKRPVAKSGRGYAITGHHEIMIPLLAAAIKAKYMEIAGKE